MSKYTIEVLKDAPLGYWRLNEAAGGSTVADSSGNGNTGTCTGTFALGASSPLADNSAGAFDVNGGLGRIRVPNSSAFNTGGTTFTIEYWAKYASTTQKNNSGLVQCNDSTGSTGWASGTQAATPWAPGVSIRGQSLVVPTWTVDTNWHHWVFVLSSTTWSIYLDGNFNGSASSGIASITSCTTQPLVIADIYQDGTATTTNCFAGYMSEVAVYSSALSAARINTHYIAGTGKGRITSYPNSLRPAIFKPGIAR